MVMVVAHDVVVCKFLLFYGMQFVNEEHEFYVIPDKASQSISRIFQAYWPDRFARNRILIGQHLLLTASGKSEYSESRLALIKAKSKACSINGMAIISQRKASTASSEHQRLDVRRLRISEAVPEANFDEVTV